MLQAQMAELRSKTSLQIGSINDKDACIVKLQEKIRLLEAETIDPSVFCKENSPQQNKHGHC
jgi:hypothetical protein